MNKMLPVLFAIICFVASPDAFADCWRLPTGQVVTSSANSTPPVRGAVKVACPNTQSAPSYPRRQSMSVSPNPIFLFAHYLDKSGKSIRVQLRDFQHQAPNFSQSHELRALASRPCGRGDNVRINSSFSGQATGIDAGGIGQFRWSLAGNYASTGQSWQFTGTLKAAPDFYNFDPKAPGARSYVGELTTRIGGMFPGKPFRIEIVGSRQVQLGGICAQGANGAFVV